MELLCRSCVANLLLTLLHGAVLQKLPFGTISQAFAWQHRARVVFRSYFLSSWSCRAKGISQSCFPQFYMEPPRKRIVRQRSWAQSELCWAQSNQSVRDAPCSSRAQVALRSCFLSFCMELSCQSFCMELLLKTCSAKLFFELLHGTVVQKLPCEAIA